MDPEIAELRAMIDEVDRRLLDVIRERVALVMKIADRKKVLGVPVFDPPREIELAKKVSEGAGPAYRAYVEVVAACRNAAIERVR